MSRKKANGHVKAWVGGNKFSPDDYKYQFDHVWQARRQPDKKVLHIPLQLGLLSQSGEQLPLTLAGETAQVATSRVLHLHSTEETFYFTGLDEEPVPALLRGFSAPVQLDYPYSHEQLALLMACMTACSVSLSRALVASSKMMTLACL